MIEYTMFDQTLRYYIYIFPKSSQCCPTKSGNFHGETAVKSKRNLPEYDWLLRFATYNYEYINGLYKYLWSISYHDLYRDYHSLVLHSRISYHGLPGCCLTVFIYTLYFYSSKLAGWLCNQGYGNGSWLEIELLCSVGKLSISTLW